MTYYEIKQEKEASERRAQKFIQDIENEKKKRQEREELWARVAARNLRDYGCN